MALDTAVSRAVHRARLLERALHDDGPWAIEYGGQSLPASKVYCASHIHLQAQIPTQCWIVDPDGIAVLTLRGEPQSVQQIGIVGDGGHDIDWILHAEDFVSA